MLLQPLIAVQFLRYGFNTAAGVLTASLGVLGFAAILLPPGGSGGGDLAVKFWAKGREDSAWYGAQHLQTMTKSSFVDEAAASPQQKQPVHLAFGTEFLSLSCTLNTQSMLGTPESKRKSSLPIHRRYR